MEIVEPVQPATPSGDLPCIDIESIIEECTPIYLNVNVHYFLDDNCEGQLAAENIDSDDPPFVGDPNEAFSAAEEFVNSANGYFKGISNNGQGQWNTEDHPGTLMTDPTCVPIRFVLKDVQIHCNTDAQSFTGFGEQNNFFSNPTSEINIFVSSVDLTGDFSSATGYATLGGNYATVNSFYTGNVMHELGHALGLEHTYNSSGQSQFVSGCPDVWTSGANWDSNGDGTEDTYIHTCWGYQGVVFDGLDACAVDEDDNAIHFTEVHPCCIWDNQDNNLMGGSGWSGNPDYGTITPCQLEIMLTNIATFKCDFIGGVDCPPPAANIGLVPLDGVENADCEFCIHFEGSMNEDEYRISFTKKTLFGGQIVYDSQWRQGPVGTFCFDLNQSLPTGSLSGILAGSTYSVTLKVQNDCGVDMETVRVTIPPFRNCNEESNKISVSVSPNPTSGLINVQYEIEEEAHLRMFIYDPLRMEMSTTLYDDEISIGEYNKSVNLNDLENGVYYLFYEFHGVTSFETILKQ